MLLSNFSQPERIIPYPRTIICNNCEEMNVSGDILNAGGNVKDEEDYEFTASFFKVLPTVIEDITKNNLTKMKLGNLIPHRDIENIEE